MLKRFYQLGYIAQFTGLFLLTSLSYALPEDRQQILQMRADQADINQETHLGVYINHVEVDQGSTHLRAAHATTEVNQKNQLTKAVAKGDDKEQAHFWTLTDVDKPPLHAYANIIRYFPERHLIQLEGNARVVQGDDSFSAPTIDYDTLHQHVVSKTEGQGQTVIIIHPGHHSAFGSSIGKNELHPEQSSEKRP